MLQIRVFKATDDLDSCKRFAEGHANVLKDYGVTKVTSSKNDWFYNPDAYVAIVETEEGEVVGGERIHLVNKDFPLPIEEAVSIVEPRVYDLVSSYADNKITGEICGLWNGKAIAGKGVSWLLTKLGVAMAHMIGMDSLFVLCAPYTVELCQNAGFVIEESIGNKGTFIYPKLDLIATALVVKDMGLLANAKDEIRQEIFGYVKNPNSTTTERGQKGITEIAYDITFPGLTK